MIINAFLKPELNVCIQEIALFFRYKTFLTKQIFVLIIVSHKALASFCQTIEHSTNSKCSHGESCHFNPNNKCTNFIKFKFKTF